MDYLYKSGQKNVCFKKYDLHTKSIQYYLLVSGYLYFNGDQNLKAQNLKLQKLKWTYNNTDLVPVDGFKFKQYFFVDRYKLEIDVDVGEKDYREICHITDFFRSTQCSHFDMETAEKFVKYRKKEDRLKNGRQNNTLCVFGASNESHAFYNEDVHI